MAADAERTGEYAATTLDRLREAANRVERGESRYGSFIEEMAVEVDAMLAERESVGDMALSDLASHMRENSERWFPRWHDGTLPLPIAYALGLGGEVGEVLNVVKKMHRDGAGQAHADDLALELADCFTYLMLLVDEAGVDLMAAYTAKEHICEQRFVARLSEHSGRSAE